MKTYFWKLYIIQVKQWKKMITVNTRCYDNMYQATSALNELGNIFHQTLIRAELNILEVEDEE